MKIVLTNAHSSNNIGDGGIVRACIALVRRLQPTAEIVLFTRYVDEANRHYHGLVDRVVAPVPLLPPPGIEPDWKRASRFLFSALTTTGYVSLRPRGIRSSPSRFAMITERAEAIRELSTADVVMPVGGGYLYSSKFHLNFTLAQHLYIMHLAHRLDRPVATFPISVGPFPKRFDRRVTSTVLKQVNSLAVREVFSRRESMELGVAPESIHLVPDVAFTFARPAPPRRLRSNRIGVTLLDWTWASSTPNVATSFQRYLDALVETCQHLQRQYAVEIVLLSHANLKNEAEQTDSFVTEQFRKRLAGEGRVSVASASTEQDVMEIFGACDLVFGSRLHSCIFALCAGTPCINLSYQPKGIGTFELLGLHDCSFDVNSVDSKMLIDKADELLDYESGNHERFANAAVAASAKVLEHYAQTIQ